MSHSVGDLSSSCSATLDTPLFGVRANIRSLPNEKPLIQPGMAGLSCAFLKNQWKALKDEIAVQSLVRIRNLLRRFRFGELVASRQNGMVEVSIEPRGAEIRRSFGGLKSTCHFEMPPARNMSRRDMAPLGCLLQRLDFVRQPRVGICQRLIVTRTYEKAE